MKLFFILLLIFIVGLYFLGPVLLVPVIIYLAVGLVIFAIGTWSPSWRRKSIIRRCERKLALKNEDIKVQILASARKVPPVTQESEPWNIILVMDNSSSMMGSPLVNAKIAAKNLVSTTPEDFQYGIVEFQEHAHIRSRLTANKKILKATISLLRANGGTAIDEGLKLALQVLQEDLTTGKKNAVILLSDGFSEPGPALQQAQHLKEQGVVIYCVALGECDQDLMRKIASSQATYFHTKNPEELKKLYHSIGTIIRNASCKEVEITEYPNVKKAPFHIVQWGEIEPARYYLTGEPTGPDKSSKIVKGEGMAVQWFLPSLKEEHTGLDYYIRSHCYGWYKVADAMAQLKLKDHDGKTHTSSSKKGPYILIIPRFFLWQVFWVFLNPLFWMIFRNLRCKGEQDIIIKPYDTPKRVPISQPDILPILEPGFKLSVSPTLALGVGYGGINAITHLKRFLWEHNQDEEIKKKVVFAGIDTVKPWLSDTVKVGHISLGLEEKLNIHAPVSNFIKQEAEKEEPSQDYTWLNARQKCAEGIDYDVGFGTNLHRSIGRLMYLEQREKFHETTGAVNIKNMIFDLYDKNRGEKIEICIAATLNGGTSSGVLLDLCYSLRRLLEELNIVGVGITLFLMDYQVEADDPQRDVKKPVVQLNKSGFINELARLFAARGDDFSPLPRDKAVKRWFDRIVWIDKKSETANWADLYPQCGMLMYYWSVGKEFRDLLFNNTRYIHNGLLVHKFETDVVYFFKRTLENYYSVRLLLTTLGSLVLGLPANPKDYSVNSVTLEAKYIDAAFELLYENPDWKEVVPALLRSKELVFTPKPSFLNKFLNLAGLTGIVERTSQNRIDTYLDIEEEAFRKLLSRWIEAILGTCKDTRTTAFKERKLPTAYFSLQRLKENFSTIRQLAEQVPDTAPYVVKKKCETVVEMSTRFISIIQDWSKKLAQWWDILGIGTEQITGTCQKLNILLNDMEKSIETTRSYTTPHFVFDADVEDKVYQTYFAHLEDRILEQLHWQVDIESESIQFIIVNDEKMNTYSAGGDKAIYDGIFDLLLSLPAYFAAEKNKWHEASIHEMIDLTRQVGHDIIVDYLEPHMLQTNFTNLLYLSPQTAEILEQRISAGMERKTVESKNPLISGFFKYKLNHEEINTRTKFNPQVLPSYVYSEEWNCYHALKIYSNLVDEEPLTPSYTVIALCRDMKKFLGAIHQGIIDNQIEARQSGSQMVYRFHTLEVPQSEESDADIINLLRRITESKDLDIEQRLAAGYHAMLKLKLASIKTALTKSQLPLSHGLLEQFIQVTSGAVEYYKNLK